MHSETAAHFATIEAAQEFVFLLEESIREASEDVQADLEQASATNQERRVEALMIVLYSLGKLSRHVESSRRILNDLRTLRRLLLEERTVERGAAANAR
jgi:hypothetical protein